MIEQIITLIVAVACYTGTLSQYDRTPTDEVLYNRSVFGQTAYTLPEDHGGVSGCINSLAAFVLAVRRHQP